MVHRNPVRFLYYNQLLLLYECEEILFGLAEFEFTKSMKKSTKPWYIHVMKQTE